MNKLNKIKFSHNYCKLNGETKAILIDVNIKDSNSLNKEFVYYDTLYYPDMLRYELPKGKVIILLFLGVEKTLFTTIRRYTDEKYRYYASSINKLFEVVMLDKDGSA